MRTWFSSLASLSAVLLLFGCSESGTPTRPVVDEVYPEMDQVPYDCGGQTQIPQSQCQALVALFNNTNEPGWTTSTNWLQDDSPCGWFGVTCLSGQVVELDLSENGLVGSIPSEMGDLGGMVELRLHQNELSGLLPPEVGNLSDLEALYLGENQLSGFLPLELFVLTELTVLDLEDNLFEGPLPPELGDLADLDTLRLSANGLEGMIPPELGNLTSLLTLDLSENLLVGEIPPELANLAALTELDLSGNGLSGDLPLVVAVRGGEIEADPEGICVLVPPGNEDLSLPDEQPYRDADLDGNGLICGLLVPGVNHPPVADPGGTEGSGTPYVGSEGGEVILDGTLSFDPDGDPLVYYWDFGDGDTGTGEVVTHVYEDSGIYEVILTVVDPFGAEDSGSTTAEIAEVAPTAVFGEPGPVEEGESFTLSLSEAWDPSPVDRAAGFEYSFDCGDGSGYGPFSPEATLDCPTLNEEIRAVGGVIRDKDGAQTEYTGAVEVLNAPPVIAELVVLEDPVLLGSEVAILASFSDPGILDVHEGTIDWGGDATSLADIEESEGAGTASGTHTFSWYGTFTVTLLLSDDGGGSAEASVEVTVLSPLEAVLALAETLDGLPIHEGIKNSLMAKLEAAAKSLEKENAGAAFNQLGAFINQVEAQYGKKLTAEQGDALLAEAMEVAASIAFLRDL